jgi:Tol biopolymer transport system component
VNGKRTIAALAALGLMALLPLTRAQGAAGIEGDDDSTTSCSSLNPGACTRRAVSSDGSLVVFTSKATNLVDGDDNDQADVFLAAVAADGSYSLTRISIPDGASGGSGAEADGDSGTATISPNGEWVAFESDATNLVGDDTNDVTDVFLYHVPDHRLTRVSVPDESTGLAQADLRSFGPSVADNGSVAFTSFANLVTSGTPQFQAVFVRRAAPAGTFLATPAADAPSRQASISADGSKVAFISAASNLDVAAEVPDFDDDVFVYTVGAGLARITADASAEGPSLRPDGASVAFVSDSAQFDGDGLADVVVMAVGGGDIKVLGDCACDPALDRSAHAPSLTAGDVVAFQSSAPLAAPVGSEQVWVRDASATLALVSQAPGGPLPNGSSRYISLSADGSRAVFTSSASNLVDSDDNDSTDVFLRQLPGGTLVRLSERPAATPPPTTPPTTPATTPPTSPPDIAPLELPPLDTEPVYQGVNRTGYWMLDGDGNVYGFGTAKVLGSPVKDLGNTHAADLEPTPSGNGYWVVDRRGRVFSYGDALHYGNADRVNFTKDEKVTSISATATGRGYWIFTTSGRVLAQGDATHYGDMSAVKLNGPVLDSIPTASGHGYYMVASDGGIFTFGDAKFYGSMGNKKLNAPVQSLVPDGDGKGYWLVASDGGVFTFETPFRGSMGDKVLNKPMTGMIPFGNGYLMVAEDGGIFNFSNLPFLGSLGDKPPVEAVVAVASR